MPWNVAKQRMLEDRGAVGKDECDLVREYTAVHEKTFLGSRLREDKEEIRLRERKR